MVHKVEAIKRLPADGIKVLWFDSRGSIEGQEFATSDEVKDLIGWCYDTWIDVSPQSLRSQMPECKEVL